MDISRLHLPQQRSKVHKSERNRKPEQNQPNEEDPVLLLTDSDEDQDDTSEWTLSGVASIYNMCLCQHVDVVVAVAVAEAVATATSKQQAAAKHIEALLHSVCGHQRSSMAHQAGN